MILFAGIAQHEWIEIGLLIIIVAPLAALFTQPIPSLVLYGTFGTLCWQLAVRFRRGWTGKLAVLSVFFMGLWGGSLVILWWHFVNNGLR